MSTPGVGAGLGRARYNLNTLAFATLLLALLAHIWFASTPLPLGGPNIALALVAVLLAVATLFVTKPIPDALATVRQQLGPIVPVAAVAVLLALWALTVYLATGTMHPTRLARMALGIGVLAATFVFVTNVPRARMLVLVFVGGTVASALIGMAVLWIGDPFVGVWLQITNVSEEDLQDMLLFGRNAGLAAHISTFGRQLAVAIPLALAALLYSNYGNRPGRQRCVAAGVFLLLMTLVTAMLMNGTRSVLLSVCVVCAIIALPALRSARPRRRLLVSTPLAALWVLLFHFNPFVGDPKDDDATTDVGGVPGDIQELAVGDAALYAGNADTVGHAFAGNVAGEDYELQLRERYMTGYGQPGVSNVRADDDGAIVLTWRKRPDVAFYQYRLRPAGSAQWPMWINFVPSLEANGARTRYEPVILEGVVTGATWPDGAADRRRLRHRVYGLQPRWEYTVELVPMTVDSRGVLLQFQATADEDGVIVITWLAPRVLGVAGYSYRTRRSWDDPWQPWQKFETPDRVIDPEITLPDLSAGGASLVSDGVDARVGHTFSGFVPWFWYIVQVRQRQASGHTMLGEVTAKPDTGGNFILTWRASREPSEVTGHQFRARKLGDAEWLAWQDFVPSLNSRAPSLKPVASLDKAACTSAQGGSGRTRCHTLEGLSADLDYRAQLRASNVHGFGAESAEFTFSPDPAGTWTFAWREPAGEPATGYQFRLWWRTKDRWWPWQDFVPTADGQGRTTADLLGRMDAQKRNVEAARVARQVGSGTVDSKRRISGLLVLDDSAQTRLHELATVFRYVRDHPFGTGVYAPTRSHVGEGAEEWLLEELLRLWPHNQFLHVWALFGHVGLALLVVFYACVLRPAILCSVFAWRVSNTDLRFLAIGVVGAWAAYTINSMLIPTGPFLGGWSHFYLLGLLFGVERLVRGTTAPAG